MKISLLPLYSQLNPGPGNCPLGCPQVCLVRNRAPQLLPPVGQLCPLSSHQALTCAQLQRGNADIIFNTSATGDGKSLAAFLPTFLVPSFRIMGLYPTIELVEDQAEQQKLYHTLFNLDAGVRIDRLFGAELMRRVVEGESNKFNELLQAIYQKPILLTNPDIFHFITHFQYQNPAIGKDLLPLTLAEWPDLWVFDEFHIFGPHQEAAALNSLIFIRHTQQQLRHFLFTSATPKLEFIELLKKAEFQVVEVKGVYENQDHPGFRQILQAVELEFVELKNSDVFTWLTENIISLRQILERECYGRGLIVVNSVALAGRITRQLQQLLPEVIVNEISGRIDRASRSRIQADLKNAKQPVLIVGTSAVDIGVDFKIHLLVFESSNAATVVQRLGRLGRHSGFSAYTAFVLISDHTPWVIARLEEKLQSGTSVTREVLQDAIAYAFDPPQQFQEYRHRWGGVQAQGMLIRMGFTKVNQPVRDRMIEDFQRVYKNFHPNCNTWFAIGRDEVGKAIQTEILRFRGGSNLQSGVWDGHHFYTYDLLRLIPYATVEVVDREVFLPAAIAAGHSAEEFPDQYISIYVRIQTWVDARFEISLYCNRDRGELKLNELSLINRLSLIGHPQTEVQSCLKKKKLLTFLVPVDRTQPNSHWDVSRTLHLGNLFGLYRLEDGSGQAYACAFNQDALLLEALKWRLKKFNQHQPQSLIF